jgi:hypothetical protein
MILMGPASEAEHTSRMHRRRPADPVLLALVLVASLLLLAGCSRTDGYGDAWVALDGDLSGVSVDVHKQVGCGCCDGWAAYLREHGATVNVQEDPYQADYRRSLGVPSEAGGCHTAFIDGYVVEGHAPIAAIVSLLTSRPDLVGIAVPGMPAVGPGMGGDEEAWNAMDVLSINPGGELNLFHF